MLKYQRSELDCESESFPLQVDFWALHPPRLRNGLDIGYHAVLPPPTQSTKSSLLELPAPDTTLRKSATSWKLSYSTTGITLPLLIHSDGPEIPVYIFLPKASYQTDHNNRARSG
ncbi:MAG: hypothetical protein HY869_15895 [Chloroflexi bacterium]|nr:hypothetical protein [Chloroflexota bacterium]